MINQPDFERKAQRKVLIFLQELNRKRTLFLKFKTTINRVLMAQKKFKKHVYNRLYVQTKLVQTIIAGLNTIRVMFIKDKACQSHYKGTLDSVNALTPTRKDVI